MKKNRDVTPEKVGQIDTEWWGAFCDSLRQLPNVSKACRHVGVSRQTAYRQRSELPEFKAMWDTALQDGLDLWEEEMARRAFEGVDKPLMYQGDVVEIVKEYSDTLAIVLMKAHRPEKYRDRMDIKQDTDLNITINFEDGE